MRFAILLAVAILGALVWGAGAVMVNLGAFWGRPRLAATGGLVFAAGIAAQGFAVIVA